MSAIPHGASGALLDQDTPDTIRLAWRRPQRWENVHSGVWACLTTCVSFSMAQMRKTRDPRGAPSRLWA